MTSSRKETPSNFAIAIDLGVKDFLVDSQGRHIENPKIKVFNQYFFV